MDAKDLRKKILEMSCEAGACHIGSSLSCVEILLAIKEVQKDDYFVFSKASGAATLYVLEDRDVKYLKENPLSYPGGSLGHGLPIAVGMSLGTEKKVYCLMSDAELQEGTTWESLLFASHHKLKNLIIIIDRNYLQALGRTEEILALEPLFDKIKAFGCEFRKVIDGHNLEDLKKSLTYPSLYSDRPIVIVAETIKGKGVKEMEGDYSYHYKNITKEQCETFSSKL